MSATVLLCLCGCPKPAHKLGKKACGKCGTCDAFELDGEVSAAEIAPGVPVAVRSEHLRVVDSRTESTSAALRRVEAERDEARAALSNALKCFDDLQTAAGLKYEELGRERNRARAERDEAERQRTIARAELASARTELEQLRRELAAAHERITVQDHGEAIDDQRIADLQRELAAERQRYDALHAETERLVTAEVLHAYESLWCATCYGRFIPDTEAAANHPHDLIPSTVTITRREEPHA